MSISNESVEAAARGILLASPIREQWDDLTDITRDILRRDARGALDALATHAADAWDAGLAKGADVAAWAIGRRPESERPDTTNPYRATK